MQQCVVAVYPSRANAEQACEELQKAGVPQRNVRLSTSEAASGTAASGYGSETSSFWDWLFGTEVPEEDRRLYHSRISQGQTALSVYLDGSPSIAPTTIESILDRCGPTDVHVEGAAASGPLDMPAQSLARGQATPAMGRGQKEQVIPLPEEQLKVGKRVTEQVHRIKTYVVDKPVQEDVTLHDERVTIEKRPARTSQAIGQPQEREYEIREHHEEPVVEKRTKAGEEVVVRREASDRTEHISDTVRKTKVDIKKDTAGR